MISDRESNLIEQTGKLFEGHPIPNIFVLTLSMMISCADALGITNEEIFSSIRKARPERVN